MTCSVVQGRSGHYLAADTSTFFLAQAGAKLDLKSWAESGAWTALALAARNSNPEFRQQRQKEVAVLPTGDAKAGAQPIFPLSADTDTDTETKKDRWIEVIDLLIASGSKVRCRHRRSGPEKGEVVSPRSLITMGGRLQVDSRDSEGRTPLMIACSVDSVGAVKALLAAGADYNAKDDAGNTPAVYSHGVEVRQLIQDEVLDAVTRAHAAWLSESGDFPQMHGP